MAKTHHTVYFELQDALAGSGCAICALALRSLRRYFQTLAYESINVPAVRDSIREARGFCEAHGYMLRESRDALGTAIIHRDLLGAISAALNDLHYHSPSLGAALRQAMGGTADAGRRVVPLMPRQPCPACVRREEIERTFVDLLLQELREEELLPTFRAGSGLCLPHLRLAFQRAPDAAIFEQLKAAQQRIWVRLSANLAEFIRKHDYRFEAEPVGAEGTSWSEAVELVSGRLGLGGSRPK